MAVCRRSMMNCTGLVVMRHTLFCHARRHDPIEPHAFILHNP